jgi:peptidoglycan hydrolase CwlO-like protein
MNEEKLDNVIQYANGLGSRIDYLEDKLTLLLEAIKQLDNDLKQLDNDVRSLKNPYSKQGRR